VRWLVSLPWDLQYEGLNINGPLTPFLPWWPKILFPIFWRPTTVGVNVVYLHGVAALVVVVVAGWSWGFVKLRCFLLLLKLTEVKNLQLGEFGEVVIEFCNCLRLFPDPMTVQGSNA
jgi:hypothetical protein